MNQIILIGQVGNKPNLFQNVVNGEERAVATFLLFTDVVTNAGETYSIRHAVRVWRNAENVAERIERGDTVLVQGSLSYYERADGSREAYVLAWQVRRLRRAQAAAEEAGTAPEAATPAEVPPAAKATKRKAASGTKTRKAAAAAGSPAPLFEGEPF